MTNDQPVTVTDQTFQREVIDHSAVVPVVVDFWDESSAPCRLTAKIMKQLAKDFAGKIRVARVDVTANPGVAQALSIRALPTLMVFKKQQLLCNQSGAFPEAVYRDLAEQTLALDVQAANDGA